MKDKLKTNPFLTIWTSPKATISQIVNFDPKYRFYLLSWIYGFALLFHAAQSMSLGAELPLYAILLGSAVLAIFFGMLGITIISALLLGAGRLLKGKATFLDIRACVSWANVTNIVNILMWFALMAYFGSSVFTKTFGETIIAGKDLAFAIPVFLIQLVVSIWSLVILIKSISQVQGFSGWRALINVIMPIAIVLLITWMVAVLLQR